MTRAAKNIAASVQLLLRRAPGRAFQPLSHPAFPFELGSRTGRYPYAHLSPDVKRAAVDTLDAALGLSPLSEGELPGLGNGWQ